MTDLLIAQVNKTFSLLSKFLNKNKNLEIKKENIEIIEKENKNELSFLPKYNSEINNKVGINFYSFKYYTNELNWTGKIKEVKVIKEKKELKTKEKNIFFFSLNNYSQELNWTGQIKEEKTIELINKEKTSINSKSIFYKLDQYLKLINWEGKELLSEEDTLIQEQVFDDNIMFYKLNDYSKNIKWNKKLEIKEEIVEEKKEVKNEMVTANFFSEINWD